MNESLSQGSNSNLISGTSNPQASVGNSGALSQNVNSIQIGPNQNILNSNANNVNLVVPRINHKTKQIAKTVTSKPLVVVGKPPIPKIDLYFGGSIILICLVFVIVVITNSVKNYNFLIKNR